MNKKQIQLIAFKMFIHGKNGVLYKGFNSCFKQAYEEVKAISEEEYNSMLDRI